MGVHARTLAVRLRDASDRMRTVAHIIVEKMVPLVRLERTLREELDFESSASTIPPQGHFPRL